MADNPTPQFVTKDFRILKGSGEWVEYDETDPRPGHLYRAGLSFSDLSKSTLLSVEDVARRFAGIQPVVRQAATPPKK